jgi:hypothetical protein
LKRERAHQKNLKDGSTTRYVTALEFPACRIITDGCAGCYCEQGAKMTNRTKGRIISGAFLVIIMAAFHHHVIFKNNQMGREAFIVKMGDRFDKFYAHPTTWGYTLGVNFALFGGMLTMYEFVAFGITKILNKLSPNSTSTLPPVISN